MTDGQRLALEQLHEIQRASDGALDIAGVRPPDGDSPSLRIDVTIDCSGMPRAPDGLPLRDRERMTIYVKARFPFEHPVVVVPHTRFAGHGHVLWARQLCLYISPATEWDASDGMYGFMTRLDAWLRDAAMDRLDPEGAPIHPPFLRQINYSAPFVIPRVDAPAVSDEPWLGFARMHVVSDRRIDLTGWSGMRDEHATDVAAAVLLPGPLPSEFPTAARDLVRALVDRGVDRRALLDLLVLTALRVSEDQPMYVVVGAKMRGVRGSGNLRQHLTVWRLPPAMATCLRIAASRNEEHEGLRRVGERAEQILEEWIDESEVQWCSVREDRPEVTIRRDTDTPIRGSAAGAWRCGVAARWVAPSPRRSSAPAWPRSSSTTMAWSPRGFSRASLMTMRMLECPRCGLFGIGSSVSARRACASGCHPKTCCGTRSAGPTGQAALTS
jgi:hypothetical protein